MIKKVLIPYAQVCKSKQVVSKTIRAANKDGIPATNAVDEKYIFRDHFSDLLDGLPCKFDYLVLDDRNVSRDRYEGIDPICLGRCIPTVEQLIMVYEISPISSARQELFA